MKTILCKQGSSEWEAARIGKVTASEADALITQQYAIRKGEGVKTYLHQKLAEVVMGSKTESGFTYAMDQGSICETLARPWFSFAYDIEVKEVGLCVGDDSRIACSPDGLIGEDGGLEIKCPTPPKHISYLLAGEVPPDYRVQCQFSLYVTKRNFWKFVSFHPFLTPLVVHVEPEPTAQQAIAEALEKFFKDFDAAYAKLAPMIAMKGRE